MRKYPELLSGIVKPGLEYRNIHCVADGCEELAELYVVDKDEVQLFTCVEHHGATVLACIVAGYDAGPR